MKRIFCVFCLALALCLALSSCALVAPRPKIKEAEFNFSVTCEIDGEEKTLSGVYVCEYEGTAFALDIGRYRVWNGYVKGGEDELLGITVGEDGGRVDVNLDFYPEYFMSDSNKWGRAEPEPNLSVHLENEEGLRILYDADEIAQVYGAKIIGYQYDKPIENSFGILG